ncbi:MAG: hypothetical protein NDF52_07550 [archaeon YNP-WB-062]|jgi:hypothetical protein|nr:hypothetical protein [Candidatus Culexarchaeum yellowstonense]
MDSLGFKQILSIMLVNLIALWLTYGYLVAANPLTIKEAPGKLNCKLSVDYPDMIVYGVKFGISGRLICEDKMPHQLMAQALLVCGDVHMLTVNTTIVRDDGTFKVYLEPSFPKPHTNNIQCGLTVHVISKTVSTGLMDKKTLTMIVPS